MRKRVTALVVIIFLSIVLLPGCQHQAPEDALRASPETLAERQLQMRRFDTNDEKMILNAAAAVFQDLGFNIDESETDLGVIVCSKKRDATSAGQIAGAIILGLFSGVAVPVDKHQLIRVSLITCPISEKSIAVRVTFQRIIYNTYNQVTKAESIKDPELYQQFYEKLSQSVFLEAHQL
ncbi:MAG: hypothetical protein KJ720_06355 [Proteobacteria bacterium]|nr:hypothetical protein [Pseudomonadota bacterium]MBU1451150.1 hypothetical protein [Pseudomonadota bacterium]MBU2467377.1 hypothetical protein [Pseudomonadota bacterium]MBU2517057.1 hypothetical protein [Pseudomonadota bacterium]